MIAVQDLQEQMPAPEPPAEDAMRPEPLVLPLAQAYLGALLKADRRAAASMVLDAVAHGLPIRSVYLSILQPAQHALGGLWADGRISVAQEHYCTAATQLVMSQLYPHLFTSARNGRTLVAACVAGDLHELGGRMVADFFELAGWDTYFTGANTPTADVVQTVAAHRADALAISTTLTRHVPAVAILIQAVRAAPACASVCILVGGHPFSQDTTLWQRVGADGWGRNADDAVVQADRLLALRGAVP